MNNKMIEAQQISKRFKTVLAVNDVSLCVEKGQIFGLLGPNAAGKTTLIRILCGIIEADQGQVLINGLSSQKAKPFFGYVAQYFSQYEGLTVWENLEFYAQMYAVTDTQRLNYLLQRYDLAQFKDLLAGSLSGGYKRRLALACALAHDPLVLFLDEPTAGIDPVTRKLLWDDFYQLSAEGKTLFVTTHYMEEAQRCHQLAFISAGSLVANGSPNDMKQALGDNRVYTTKLAYKPEVQTALQQHSGIILVNQFGNELRIVATPEVNKIELENTIASIVRHIIELDETQPNLEDAFIVLTQNSTSPQKMAEEVKND